MKVSDNKFPKLLLTEGTSPETPESGTVAVFANLAGAVYAKDDNGVETPLGGGGGGGGGSAPVVALPGVEYTLNDLIEGAWHEFTAASPVTITVMDEIDEPIPANAEFGIMAAGPGGVIVVSSNSAVIVAPKGGSLELAEGGFAMLKRRAGDLYKLIGETEDGE